MEEEFISVGSIVQLSSGGPWMTVSKIEFDDEEEDEGSGDVTCMWFQEEGTDPRGFAVFAGHPLEEVFRSETLVLLGDEGERESSW